MKRYAVVAQLIAGDMAGADWEWFGWADSPESAVAAARREYPVPQLLELPNGDQVKAEFVAVEYTDD